MVNSQVETRDVSRMRNAHMVEENKIPKERKSMDDPFSPIKTILKDQHYGNKVSYDFGDNNEINISEIISYLVLFDANTYGDVKHPVNMFSESGSAVRHYVANKYMRKYIHLLPKILELRDIIYRELPESYNKSPHTDVAGRFGKLTGVKEDDSKLNFIGGESKYKIPMSFIYPILASFRSAVCVQGATAYWATDPVTMFYDLKYDLAWRVGEQAKVTRNPKKLGNNIITWQTCYDAVRLEMMKRGMIKGDSLAGCS